MTNHWEIELSGTGIWDGRVVPVPKDGDKFPPMIYKLALPQPIKSVDSLEEVKVIEFEFNRRNNDGIFVYRQKKDRQKKCPHCGNDRDSYKCKCGNS